MSIIQIYITDKSGNKYWKTLCSAKHKERESIYLQHHLNDAVNNPELYDFLDLESASIEVETVVPSPYYSQQMKEAS